MNPIYNTMVKWAERAQKGKHIDIQGNKCVQNITTPKRNTTQALRHEHDPPGEVGLEERPRSRARVLEPPRPDPGLRPKDRGRMGNNVRYKIGNLGTC